MVNTSVPAGLQLFPRPRRRIACKDLAWDYPGVTVQGGCVSLEVPRVWFKYESWVEVPRVWCKYESWVEVPSVL